MSKILSQADFLATYDSGEEINERTLLEYAYGGEELVRDTDHRWTNVVEVIVEICGRYFRYTYSEGKTECQEDNCYNQPVEVIKVEHDEVVPEHVIRVVEWVEKST